MLLLRLGTSTPVPPRLAVSSLIHIPDLRPPSRPDILSRTLPLTLPFSIRRPFHPSNSRSSLSALSFSSWSSLSARRADIWLVDSEACNSSIVFKSFSILSRSLAASSAAWVACLSFRSICDCMSFTMRSTLRTERCDLDFSVSCSSSCDSSCILCQYVILLDDMCVWMGMLTSWIRLCKNLISWLLLE